jgi:hypothetical protein
VAIPNSHQTEPALASVTHAFPAKVQYNDRARN